MGNRRVAICLLLLVIAASGAWLFLNRPGASSRINLNPYEALGTVAAEETSKLLGHRGGVVLAINDPGDERDPVLEAQLRAFTRTLARIGKTTVRSIERIKMDAMTRMATGGTMPPDQFTSLRARYGQADAFVFFIGFPMLSASELKALKGVKTKFVVVSAALPGYRQLLDTGVIQLAIVPRLAAPEAETAEAATVHEWFAREYQVVTPETANQLPF